MADLSRSLVSRVPRRSLHVFQNEPSSSRALCGPPSVSFSAGHSGRKIRIRKNLPASFCARPSRSVRPDSPSFRRSKDQGSFGDFSHNLLQSPDSYSFLVSGEWYTRLYFYAAAWLVPLPKASMIIYCVILLYYILKYWNRNDSIWMKMRLPILAALLSVTLASFTALIDHFVEGETYLRFGGFVGSLCVFFIYLLDRRFFEPLRIRNKTREYRQSRIKRLDKNSLRSAVLSLMDAEKLFLTEDLSLQMLSNELSDNGFEINPSQLSEFINSEFGKNYNQFLNEYRIREACEMLISEPERSVLSIALAAGFNSKSTFNRVFKTLLKITPLEYRESRSNQYI
uniref:HTH araC/xylS-type domain-containing protein n=1 Tax=Leptospira ellisii TaxID=2023197 RepID=A0A2N0B3Z6_9LEPT|nr:hypothetical protein CH379_19815 [Leptospira ellisii]